MDTIENQFMREFESLETRIEEIDRESGNMVAELGKLGSSIVELSGRIEDIRRRGYIFRSWLEKDAKKLEEMWRKEEESVKKLMNDLSKLSDRAREILDRLRRRMRSIDVTVGNIRINFLGFYRSEIEDLEESLREHKSQAQDYLGRYGGKLGRTRDALNRIEKTLKIIEEASFNLKEGENIVEAFRATLMGDGKKGGYIHFTDSRFLFEEEKEIVLKKVLFIATKKKKVREVLFETPIGYIKGVTKGRVGLLEWTGIYVNLKEGRELVFDVSGNDADRIIEVFEYIESGEVDRDRVKGAVEVKPIVKLECPYCGAPITRKPERGEVAIKCEYCGKLIPIEKLREE